jgi:hypothetical protein
MCELECGCEEKISVRVAALALTRVDKKCLSVGEKKKPAFVLPLSLSQALIEHV